MEATRPVSDAGQKAAIFVTVTPEKGKPIARWGRKVTGLAGKRFPSQIAGPPG